MATLKLKRPDSQGKIEKKSRVIEMLEAERDAHIDLMEVMRPDDSRRYYAEQTLRQLNDKIDFARAHLMGAGG